MTDAVCGEAAAAMDLPALAAASAELIADDVTPTVGRRPKMPPAPAPVLSDWERETLQRWADAPVKGPPPPGNRAARIRINRLPATATSQLSFVATTEDPDNDSVVGVIRLGDLTVKMDHPGTFAVRFNLAGHAFRDPAPQRRAVRRLGQRGLRPRSRPRGTLSARRPATPLRHSSRHGDCEPDSCHSRAPDRRTGCVAAQSIANARLLRTSGCASVRPPLPRFASEVPLGARAHARTSCGGLR